MVKKKQQLEHEKHNHVVDTYYELSGDKISLVKVKDNGNKYRVYIGRLKKEKKYYDQLKAHYEKWKAEGKVRQRML